MRESTIIQPRLGAFVTMTVGLLLFFGFVSRIHEVRGPILSAARKEAPPSPQERLADENQKAAVVFGNHRDAAESLPPVVREFLETPLEESQPADDAPAANPKPAPPATPATPRPEARPLRKRYYTVRANDTLWRIAQHEYGNGRLNYVIRQANPDVDPHCMPVGKVIEIPPLESMQPSDRR